MNQCNPEKYLELLQKAVKRAFLHACRGNESIAREAMEEWAKEHLIESEQEKVSELSDAKLLMIVSNMVQANPQELREFMEIVKLTADVYFALNPGEEPGLDETD